MTIYASPTTATPGRRCCRSDLPGLQQTLTPSSVTDGDGHVWVGTYNISAPSPTYDQPDLTAPTTTAPRSRRSTRRRPIAIFTGFVTTRPTTGCMCSSETRPATVSGSRPTTAPPCSRSAPSTMRDDRRRLRQRTRTAASSSSDRTTTPTQNHIVKVSLETGELTNVLDLPYDSFSTYRLNPTTYLVGTTHEGPDLRSPTRTCISTSPPTASPPASSTPSNGRSRTQRPRDLQVQFSYPNGDFPIQIDGYGTIIATSRHRTDEHRPARGDRHTAGRRDSDRQRRGLGR